MKWIGFGLSMFVACVASGQGSMRSAPVVPPSKEVSELLKKMRTAYSTAKSAKMATSFTQTEQGRGITILSKGSYRAPASFRIESTGLPGFAGKAYLLITDGKRIQVDGMPGKPVAETYGVQTMVEDLPHTNLEVLCFWDWKRQLSTERGGNMRASTFKLSTAQWKGKSFKLLEETAKAQGILVKYFIDPKSSLIWKTEQYRLGAKTPFTSSWIDKMEINTPVDSKIFKITAKPAEKSVNRISA
jgi:hypothetical protein